jgi:hypothetical protein
MNRRYRICTGTRMLWSCDPQDSPTGYVSVAWFEYRKPGWFRLWHKMPGTEATAANELDAIRAAKAQFDAVRSLISGAIPEFAEARG